MKSKFKKLKKKLRKAGGRSKKAHARIRRAADIIIVWPTRKKK